MQSIEYIQRIRTNIRAVDTMFFTGKNTGRQDYFFKIQFGGSTRADSITYQSKHQRELITDTATFSLDLQLSYDAASLHR